MFVSDQRYPSSYKGAGYLYKTGDITSGRKTAIKEYPNKDFRTIEDLGRNLRIFNIQGIVHGINYLLDKQRLEDALNSPGIGTLIHPYYGSVQVHALNHSITETDTEIGIARFNMNFAEGEENFSPRVSDNNTSLIANIYRDLYDQVNQAINLEWTVNFIRDVKNYSQAIQKLLNRVNAISRIANSFTTNKDDFVKKSDNFSKNRFKAPTNPSLLADSFTDTISSFDNITDDYEILFDISNKAYGLGLDDTYTDLPTAETLERNNNLRFLNGLFNYLMLTNLYNNATQLQYPDEIKLNNIQSTLNANYEDLTTNPNYTFDNNLRYQITRLRNESRRFFDNLRLTVAKVTTIKTQKIPAAVLTYNYYGSTDNYQELINLNDITNPAVIAGDIRILEAQ